MLGLRCETTFNKFSRRARRRTTTCPEPSSPARLQRFFPRSIPRILICIALTLSSCCIGSLKLPDRRGGPFHNASKAAVRLMTKWVAVQHGKDNIRANSVHPGIMPPMRTPGRTADPAVRAERMRFIPMRRPGEVDEVAYTILFLASDGSPYITGSEIHVDGGILAI